MCYTLYMLKKTAPKKILTDFHSCLATNSTFCFYPPILDKNPVFAAEALTIKDSEKYYPIMIEAFNSLVNGEDSYTILKDSIMSSNANFLWFCNFTRKLEDLLQVENKFEFPYQLAPKEVKHEILQFQPPFYKAPNKVVAYRKYKILSTDPIDKHRIEYIKKDLELWEFREGFPGWYLMHDTTVYERYNEKTNVRVRIDFRHGEFMYFVCGASDNWQQIMDVPLEMDSIVSALLFRE